MLYKCFSWCTYSSCIPLFACFISFCTGFCWGLFSKFIPLFVRGCMVGSIWPNLILIVPNHFTVTEPFNWSTCSPSPKKRSQGIVQLSLVQMSMKLLPKNCDPTGLSLATVIVMSKKTQKKSWKKKGNSPSWYRWKFPVPRSLTLSVGCWASQYTVSLLFLLIGHWPEFYIISACTIFGGIIPLQVTATLSFIHILHITLYTYIHLFIYLYIHISYLVILYLLSNLPHWSNSQNSQGTIHACLHLCHVPLPGSAMIWRFEQQTNCLPWKINYFDGVFPQEKIEN